MTSANQTLLRDLVARAASVLPVFQQAQTGLVKVEAANAFATARLDVAAGDAERRSLLGWELTRSARQLGGTTMETADLVHFAADSVVFEAARQASFRAQPAPAADVVERAAAAAMAQYHTLTAVLRAEEEDSASMTAAITAAEAAITAALA